MMLCPIKVLSFEHPPKFSTCIALHYFYQHLFQLSSVLHAVSLAPTFLLISAIIL